ncbi:MAG: CpsB/CapC family capsule biosynthesis tyrosine phosphatase [Clostridiaceae bacterium]
MIDIHSHILPGIDDGAKNIDTFLKMIKIAKQDGIEKIIATPHFVNGIYENTYDQVAAETDKMKDMIQNYGINLELIPGQEVYLDKHSIDLYKEGKIRGINASSYLLCEFPMDSLPDNALDIIYELQIAGAKIILAHPERYMYFIKNLTLINDFIKEGCLFQINSGSIEGIFGKEIRKTAMLLIKNGICDFIASDAHSAGTRSPRIKDTINAAEDYKPGISDTLVKNPYFLINNEEINVKYRKLFKKPKLFFNK